MFDYEYVSKEDAEKARYSLMSDGTYDAVIKYVDDRLSKSGNSMIEVELQVYDRNGVVHQVPDYWTFMDKMMWKIIHGMEACGLEKEYENHTFKPTMLDNKHVKVVIGTEQGKEIPADKLNGKPSGTMYYDKNKIMDYVVGELKPSTMQPLKSDGGMDMDDELPF